MADIVLFGAGEMADVARVYVDTHGPDRIVGFTVDRAYKHADSFAGRPLVAWEDLENGFPPDRVKLLGPVSFRRLNDFRRDRYLEGKRRGYSFASFVHPAAHVYATDVGENAFILLQTVVEPFAKIGCNVILLSGNHVGHHTVIGDHCFVAAHASIGANVSIGERSFIGGRVAIAGGISIGAATVLTQGAQIEDDLPPETVVMATPDPAKPYRSARIKRLF